MGKIENLFTYKSVTPSSLVADNIIQFSYASPKGVHDNKPMVLVTEKRSDRIFGINLHYDNSELSEAIDNMQDDIMGFLEGEYFKKYPQNKKKLQESRQKFDKSLITEAEYKEMMRRYNRGKLDEFLVESRDMNAMRCYIYQRMTAVSKLVWRV